MENYESLVKSKFLCPICSNSFAPRKHFQVFCSDLCEEACDKRVDEFNKSKILYCIDCNGIIVRTGERGANPKRCHSCLKLFHKKRQSKLLDPSKWANRKRRSFSMTEDIKRMERERLYGKESWTHFEKGRKYDKI